MEEIFRPPFSVVVGEIGRYVEGVQEVKIREGEARQTYLDGQARTEEFVREVEGLLDVQFSPQAFHACEGLCAELEGISSSTPRQTLTEEDLGQRLGPAITDFERLACAVPASLKRPGSSVQALLKFTQAKMHSLSPEGITQRLTGTLKKKRERDFDASPFEQERQELTHHYRRWLALSDHLPIHTTFHPSAMEGGRALRVASWNIQEFVQDGVSHYACRMPGVANSKGTGTSKALIQAMTSPVVLEEQVDQLRHFLRLALLSAEGHDHGICVDAVCLQEVSTTMLEHLRALAEAHGLGLCSAGEPSRSPTACDALTCILTRPSIRALPLPPVTVEVRENTKVNSRQFAGVHLPEFEVVLCSVHVRHPNKKAPHSTHNLHNITHSLNSLATSFEESEVLAAAAGPSNTALLCVGDFNGNAPAARECAEEGSELHRGLARFEFAFPDEQTIYDDCDSGLAIDGSACTYLQKSALLEDSQNSRLLTRILAGSSSC